MTIASIWGENMLGSLSLNSICFLVAHSFPLASLSENCSLLGTDNVRGQISVQISRQMATIIYITHRNLNQKTRDFSVGLPAQ